jgi:HEAT repeat protein
LARPMVIGKKHPFEIVSKDDPRGYYEVVDASTAVPILWELTKDKDSGVRLAAATALVRPSPESGPALVPVLTELLKDKDPDVRWIAIQNLRDIGPEAKAALPALLPMIHDSSWAVKSNIAEALEKISPEAAKTAVPEMMELLKDDDISARVRTARVLIKLDPGLKSVVIPVLVAALTGKDLGARGSAAKLLGEIGFEAKEGSPAIKAAVPALVNLMKNDKGNPFAQLDAAAALAKLDPSSKPVVVSALIDFLKHPYWGIRMQAANILADIGPDAKAAVPALNELLKDRETHVRDSAKKALEKIQGSKG